MKIKKRALIIGHTAVFVAIGCGNDTDPVAPDNAIMDTRLDMGGHNNDAEASSLDMMTMELDQQVPGSDRGILRDAVVLSPDMRVAERDMEPVITDMAGAPMDMAMSDARPGPQERCADLEDTPCEVESEGCCLGDTPVVICRDTPDGNQWVALRPGDGFCECLEGRDGRTMVVCAVPGFVGISTAGKVRRRAPRLRDLLS